MCGENSASVRAWVAWVGSSPRVRGKRELGQGREQVVGLIPACAGKTVRSTTPVGVLRAHPRVCGENDRAAVARLTSKGSSPRVRGKPPSKFPKLGPGGLIPACAGKTPFRLGVRGRLRAHPRVCGENHMVFVGWWAVNGSSPRVRGKRLALCRPWCGRGLIPACAGKTLTDLEF